MIKNQIEVISPEDRYITIKFNDFDIFYGIDDNGFHKVDINDFNNYIGIFRLISIEKKNNQEWYNFRCLKT